MPQPMSTTRRIHFDFSPDAALKRPKLGAYVTVISNFWNEIEARIAIFLAALLGAEASTVLTIFLTIQSDSAKRAVIDKIVSMKLDKTQQATFSTAIDLIGRRYSERNRCVHGAWGVSIEYPDALLWTDVRETNILAVELMALAAKNDFDGQHTRMRESQRGILIYKENDFIDMHNRFVEAFNELNASVAPFINQAFGANFLATPRVPLLRV
jgi:hypothetical protein